MMVFEVSLTILSSSFILLYLLQVFALLIISHKDHGGYEMNDSSVGLCFMVAGTVEMLYQVR